MKRKDVYHTASWVIEKACSKQGSLKQLCYSCEYKKKKQLFAMVFQTVKYKPLLEKIIGDVDKLLWDDSVKPCSRSLKLVLLYETVLGKGIPHDNEYSDLLLAHYESICNMFQDVSNKFPQLVEKVQGNNAVALPRYVRVNTLKVSVEEAVKHFERIGYELVKEKEVRNLSESEFLCDDLMTDLLVFSSSADLHEDPLYKCGKILFQDKASCLPAFILNPPPNSIVMDACAAPGNKSSHAASILRNSGTVYSFDRDKARFQTMNKLLSNVGATCVQTALKDFMKVRHDAQPYCNAEYIIVDPSCSGSGIVSRMDDLVDNNNDEREDSPRLKALAGFQTAVLSHALSFPSVSKVVYSTCSVHKKENEDVVEKACKRFANTYRLVNVLPQWKNRGIGEWEDACKCVRAVPETDNCNGFFVALFERIAPSVEQDKQISEAAKVETSIEENCDPKVQHSTTNNVRSKKKRKHSGVSSEASSVVIPAPFSVQRKKKKASRGVKKPVTS